MSEQDKPAITFSEDGVRIDFDRIAPPMTPVTITLSVADWLTLMAGLVSFGASRAFESPETERLSATIASECAKALWPKKGEQ